MKFPVFWRWRRQKSNCTKKADNGRKSTVALLRSLATEPGIAMIGAHVLFSAAVGGLALGIAAASFVTAAGLKIARETSLAERFQTGWIKNTLNSVNTPMKSAGIALLALSGLSFSGGLGLLGTAFALFGSGNLVYNTPLTQKFPIDNVLFTAGSAITAFIGGGSLMTSGIIGAAGTLSAYNLIKPGGPDVNRNLGRPKLWFAAAQGASAVLGFLSGQPSRLLPSIALCSVTWGYVAMEGRTSGWFDSGEQGDRKAKPDRQDRRALLKNNVRPKLAPHPSKEIRKSLKKMKQRDGDGISTHAHLVPLFSRANTHTDQIRTRPQPGEPDSSNENGPPLRPGS